MTRCCMWLVLTEHLRFVSNRDRSSTYFTDATLKSLFVFCCCVYICVSVVCLNCVYIYSRPAVVWGTLPSSERGPTQTAQLEPPPLPETETSWCAFCRGIYCLIRCFYGSNCAWKRLRSHRVIHQSFSNSLKETHRLSYSSFVRPRQGLLVFWWNNRTVTSAFLDRVLTYLTRVVFKQPISGVNLSLWVQQ